MGMGMGMGKGMGIWLGYITGTKQRNRPNINICPFLARFCCVFSYLPVSFILCEKLFASFPCSLGPLSPDSTEESFRPGLDAVCV